MNSYRIVKSDFFIVIGISHQVAEVSVREQFSIDEINAIRLMKEYKGQGGEAIFVLSTCNRTEIYALANSDEEIRMLLLKYTKTTKELVQQYCYTLTNSDAIAHLFKVSVGLESQILGDFQIIGQLKNAFRLSKHAGASNAFTERLINTVSQTSKQVKNETEFSTGAASTSFAAVNYIKQHIPSYINKKVLLYGTGKIGQLVCENLIKHISKDHITVVNRSSEKASRLVDKYNIRLGRYQDIVGMIRNSDIVIVATASSNPTITADMIPAVHEKHFIDLSMPRNVSEEARKMPNIHVIGLDELSQIADDTLKRRKEEIDHVLAIIDRNIGLFKAWQHQRKYVPTINAIRENFEKIQNAEIDRYKKEFTGLDDEHIRNLSSDIIQKITNQLSNQLRTVPTENMELVHHLFRIDSRNL